jgi:hypothetical protein
MDEEEKKKSMKVVIHYSDQLHKGLSTDREKKEIFRTATPSSRVTHFFYGMEVEMLVQQRKTRTGYSVLCGR